MFTKRLVFKINYKVKIEDSELCECENEGNLILSISGNKMRTYFQADKEFYNDIILPAKNKKVNIDLWLVYGNPRKIDMKEKMYPSDLKIAGGNIKGEIVNIISSNEFRLDCGFQIDIDSESELANAIQVGDYIAITGTYQVFFPESKYQRE